MTIQEGDDKEKKEVKEEGKDPGNKRMASAKNRLYSVETGRMLFHKFSNHFNFHL